MSWTHGIFEMFCFYDTSKDKITKWVKFEVDDDGNWIKDNNGSFKTTPSKEGPNPCYIKDGEKLRPKWCKRMYGKNRKGADITPKNECLYDKCPYLSITGVDKSEYIVMLRAWEEAGRKGCFKHLEDGIPASKPTQKKKQRVKPSIKTRL